MPNLRAAAMYLKAFDEKSLVRDVPLAFRRDVVNVRPRWSLDFAPYGNETADLAVLWDGNSVLGTVQDKSFVVQTQTGGLDVPVESLLAIQGLKTEPNRQDFCLADGQIIRGTAEPSVLSMVLPGGGKASVPLRSIQWFAFHPGGPRPASAAPKDAIVCLHSGGQLAFDPNGLVLSFGGGPGAIRLDARAIAEVETLDLASGLRVVRFRNGGRLLCQPEGGAMTLPTKYFGKRDVPLKDIGLLHFGDPGEGDANLLQLVLMNGSVLRGHLKDRGLLLTERREQVSIPEASIRSLVFGPAEGGGSSPGRQVTVRLWGGAQRLGTIASRLDFEVGQNSHWPVEPDDIASLGSPKEPSGLPTDVEAIIMDLGSSTFAARETASLRLVEIGTTAVPALINHLSDSDPEIRTRVKQILDDIRGPGRAEKEPGD
jgi:hypothetical protein